MVKRQVTSLRIDPQIWKDAKIASIDNDMQLSELLEEAVIEWLKKNKKR